MQTHVAITSSVYLKNNTLKELQQHFQEWFEAFSPFWQKKKTKQNQKVVPHSNQYLLPNSRADTQSVSLHQVLRVDAYLDKVT